jgi:6,7-dimethyl-8-ribityllumazine synthase
MNSPDVTFAVLDPGSVDGLRIGIVAASWHDNIVSELMRGCREVLTSYGISERNIVEYRCPGTYEIPVLARTMIDTGLVDAIIALGVVVRGETPHFEYVASPVMHGLQQLAVTSGIPCIAGILTTETLQQAWDRSGGSVGHKGKEAAEAALYMASTIRRLRST